MNKYLDLNGLKYYHQTLTDKIEDKYLRRDGSNEMKADLNMFSNNIRFVQKLLSPGTNILSYSTFLLNYINLFDEHNGISFVLTKNSSGEKSNIKCSMNEYGEWIATGFKTTNQSSFGLLGNEGSVVTAMTDSDIDSCIVSVFA